MRGGAVHFQPRTRSLRTQHAHTVFTLRTEPPERRASRLLSPSPAPQARAGLPPGSPRTAQPRTTEVTHLPTRLRSAPARDRRFHRWRTTQKARRAEARRRFRVTRNQETKADDAGQPSLRRGGRQGNQSLSPDNTRRIIRDRAQAHARAYESHLRIGLTPNARIAASRAAHPTRGAGVSLPPSDAGTPRSENTTPTHT
jgi:hypothetical protein